MAVYTIYATVTAQDITLSLGDVKVVSGSKDIYQLELSFSEEWASYTKKVVFETPEPKRSVIEILLDGTNICTIPTRSLSNPTALRIGVYGVGTNYEEMPTVWSERVPIYEGTYKGYENPPAPDPDVYDEILAAMAGKQDILTWDDVPTDGSDNPVKSNGIYDALETKANTEGIYPELVAGSAEQMLSGNYTVDKAPYLFRALPFKSNRVRESIVGGSFGWNQLISPNFTTSSSNGLTFTNNADGSITVDGTAEANSFKAIKTSGLELKQNHVYYNRGYKQPENYVGGSFNVGTTAPDTGNGKVYKRTTADTTTNYRLDYKTGEKFNNMTFYPQWYDLTAMFGTTIADYVHTLEQATAGSGIAWLKSYGFFTEPYYAYDAGSIQSVSTDAKKVVGFNQFNGSFEIGKRWSSGSVISANNKYAATSTFVRALPNTEYCFALPDESSSIKLYIEEFDASGSWLRNLSSPTVSSTTKFVTFTTNADVEYLSFWLYRSASDLTSAEISRVNINFSDPSKNGQYQPYQSTTYELDPIELRGLPKLDSGNNLYYDGDVYSADGTVTRKYALVDLGELNWTYDTSLDNPFFRAPLGTMKSGTVNMILAGYVTVSGRTELTANMTICPYGARICVRNDAYTDAPTFKTAMSGKYLLYEVATPTTETSTPFPSIESLYTGGTEEFTDYAVSQGTRDVAIPVGHESEYLEDSQAKLDGLPWNFATLIAPTEVTFTATRNYTTGDLLIINNILYKATANIANGGTITPNTNVTATTLAEVISAL